MYGCEGGVNQVRWAGSVLWCYLMYQSHFHSIGCLGCPSWRSKPPRCSVRRRRRYAAASMWTGMGTAAMWQPAAVTVKTWIMPVKGERRQSRVPPTLLQYIQQNKSVYSSISRILILNFWLLFEMMINAFTVWEIFPFLKTVLGLWRGSLREPSL